jgi:hypothetical protein
MFKMSTCGVTLLLAGLVACSNQSGLNVTGGSTSGGQGVAGSGGSAGGGQTTGPSDCEKAGGTCDPITPGGCLGGWSPNTDGYSCGSSTTFCCLPLSYSPCETAGGTCVWTAATCPSGTVDNTSQYQWSQYACSSAGGPSTCCMPSANGGASGTGGASGGTGSSGATGGSGGVGGVGSGGTGTGGTVSCLPPLCFIPACAGELQPNPNDPCGCPICVPNPDAGIAKDAGSPDSPICLGPAPPCVAPPKTCPAGSQLVSPPCGCTGCMPVDGGASDAGKPDAPVICNVMCPMMACTYGYLPNPEPCGCSSCAPAPDAGTAKDAQDADTRTPLLHRSAGATCPTGRGPGLSICDCTVSDGRCLCVAGECGQDSNCTAGISGRCLWGGPPLTTACSYDTCFSDADCPANTPCDCRASTASSEANSCLTGSDCRVDSDCGPGNFCSPSQYGQWCGFTYHCHTASDTCLDDSDCVGVGCNFNTQTGHWACGGDCGPAPG